MSYSGIAGKMGCAKSTVQGAFGLRKGRPGYVPAKVVPVEKQGRSISDFRRQYDKDTIVPAKIRAALKTLGSAWVYEKEFVKMADVSFADIGNYREMFEDFFITLPNKGKRVWGGTAKFVKQLSEVI